MVATIALPCKHVLLSGSCTETVKIKASRLQSFASFILSSANFIK